MHSALCRRLYRTDRTGNRFERAAASRRCNGVEFFRWDENNTPEDIRQSAEVWGLPTLYLPNRFADGVLKTSDATYQLPVNEAAPFHNHIHGFLHKREHNIVAYSRQ